MSGAVEAAHDFLQTLHPQHGETVHRYAIRLYDWQMEVYSAHAMTDLWVPFHTHPKKVQDGWIAMASERMIGEACNG